jgi:hypothetical protein
MVRSKSKWPGGNGDIQKGESFKAQGIFIFRLRYPLEEAGWFQV